MSRTVLIFFALTLWATSAVADSTTLFYGPVEKQVYVSETQFPGKSGNQTLCAQVTDWHVFYVPWKREISHYVFSETACQGESGRPIPFQSIGMLKTAGILPEAVPLVPSVPLAGIAGNPGALIFAVVALIGFPLLLRQRMRLAARRILKSASDPVFCDILLTLMFHTAQRDGAVDKTELRVIMRTYKELTGGTVTPEMAAEKFGKSLQDDFVLHSVKDYSGPEAAMLLTSAVTVATHQGSLSRERLCLLTRLNQTLDGDAGEFETMIARTLHPKATYAKTALQAA